LFVVAAALLSPMAVAPLPAQQLQTNFMALNYIGVPPDQRPAYEKFLREESAKLTQAAVEAGLIRGRTYLRLTQPFSNSEKYQYIISTWYDKAPTMDEAQNAAWDAAAKKAGHASYAAYMAKSRALGSVSVFSEMRRANLMLGSVQEGDFVRAMAYQVSPADMTEYLDRLRLVSMPLNKSNLHPDHLRASLISTRLLPNGAESDANLFYTVVAKTFADILVNPNPMTEAAFKKVHPSASYPNYIRDNADWARRAPLVRTRTMRVMMTFGKMPDAAPSN
jgi:hypothetical protein